MLCVICLHTADLRPCKPSTAICSSFCTMHLYNAVFVVRDLWYVVLCLLIVFCVLCRRVAVFVCAVCVLYSVYYVCGIYTMYVVHAVCDVCALCVVCAVCDV